MLGLTRRALLGSGVGGLAIKLASPRRGYAAAAPQLEVQRKYEVYLISDDDSSPMALKQPNTFNSCLFHFSIQLLQPSGDSKPASSVYRLHHDTDGTVLPAQAMMHGVSSSAHFKPPFATSGLPLSTRYSYGGRGAELSDLLLTGPPDWKLFTFDDRTGIVFEVMPVEESSSMSAGGISSWEVWHSRALEETSTSPFALVPRFILPDGDGDMSNGFKAEWSTMKDSKIVVGSHGYEVWRSGPPFLPGAGMRNTCYVKEIDLRTGAVQHVDWSPLYNKLAAAAGVKPGGYLTHEAAAWSDIHKRWFFMPRKLSVDKPWDPMNDPLRGANILISCKDGGRDIRVVKIKGATEPARGFSAMRFVPGTDDKHIIATKTVELQDSDAYHTYITIVTTEGKVLLPETLISDTHKYEGLEISSSFEEES